MDALTPNILPNTLKQAPILNDTDSHETLKYDRHGNLSIKIIYNFSKNSISLSNYNTLGLVHTKHYDFQKMFCEVITYDAKGQIINQSLKKI